MPFRALDQGGGHDPACVSQARGNDRLRRRELLFLLQRFAVVHGQNRDRIVACCYCTPCVRTFREYILIVDTF